MRVAEAEVRYNFTSEILTLNGIGVLGNGTANVGVNVFFVEGPNGEVKQKWQSYVQIINDPFADALDITSLRTGRMIRWRLRRRYGVILPDDCWLDYDNGDPFDMYMDMTFSE